jgi:hypothetical protein
MSESTMSLIMEEGQDGSSLHCRASNPALREADLTASLTLNVLCKFRSSFCCGNYTSGNITKQIQCNLTVAIGLKVETNYIRIRKFANLSVKFKF